MPSVLFVMADYGHDPTETAIPYRAFKEANYDISFATESGKEPKCDTKMLTGWTQKLLGATADACAAHEAMLNDSAIRGPLSWTAEGFSFEPYDIIFYPGGHEKGVRQVIESRAAQSLLAAHWPLIQASNLPRKAVVAICHGVLAVAQTEIDGQSVLAHADTTTLPATYETVAYRTTSLFLGDYYKTFGAGTDNTEDMVKKALRDPDTQFKTSLNPAPFVVADEKLNYLSGRFPPDAQLLAERAISLFN